MSVYLVRRESKKGARWHVRCELPTAGAIHLGVFDTERRAKTRAELARDEIAAGRIPQRFAVTPITPTDTTVAQAATEWLATLHDIADSTRSYYQRSARTIPAWLARMDPHAVTHTDIQILVTELSTRFKRGTIDRELAVIRMILDQAGVRANPVTDKRVRLPRKQRKAYRLPTKAHIALLHEALPTRVALLTLLEHTGLRIHEAAALRWRDIDHARGRLLVADSKTAAGRRFVEHLPGAPPFPQMPEGADANALVFAKPSARSLTSVLREVHNDHGLPLYSAHDWRHLHCSRLLHEGTLSPAEIAARVGHSNPGVTLGTYSHLVPPG